MSQAGRYNPSNFPGGFVQTLTGNAGTANPVAGNINIVTANTNVQFIGAGNTLTQDFALTSNLILGSPSLVTGTNNTAVGTEALLNIGTGSANTVVGHLAGTDITVGGGNVIVGSAAGAALASGNNNTLIGTGAGSAYNSVESYNIVINNTGTALDVGTIRIGTNGVGPNQQSECFIAGIQGVTVANPLSVVINSVTGQLGTTSSSSFIWQNQSANFNIAFGNGYVIQGGAPTVATLPTVIPSNPAAIATFRITAGSPYGSGWTIAQNINQFIIFGGLTTTPGVGGSLSSTAIGDSVEIVCMPGINPAVFIVISSVGNITIV